MAKSRPFPVVSGVAVTTATFSRTKESGFESVDTTVNSPSTDNPFKLRRYKTTGSVINGTKPNGQYAANFPSNFYDGRFSAVYPTRPNTSAMLARLYANTNPTRAEVLLPVYFLELREIPAMLHHAGQVLLGLKYSQFKWLLSPKQLAASNLAAQFGWLPLVGDLKKLIQFQQLTAKRMLEMDKLHSGKGLQRRMTLHQADVKISALADCGGGPVNSTSTPVTGTGTIEVWGTCKWKPTPVPKGHPTRRLTQNQLQREMLGLSANHITANIWNALPWSWLVDWFTGFGDLIEANSGRLLATPSRPCIMTHLKCDKHHVKSPVILGGTLPPVEVSAGHAMMEEKIRDIPLGPGLLSSFPLFSGRQLSILASLAVLRGQGRGIN